MTSYCTICDANGPCTHDGARRYLDPILYNPAVKDGKQIGWHVPDDERERWENPVVIHAASPTNDARPLAHLQAELEAWLDITGTPEQLLRGAYQFNPARVTRIVEHVIDQTRRGALTNPSGLLVTKLRSTPQPAETP